MKEESEIIVDRGQFDNQMLLCGYCLAVRNKEIRCLGGQHQINHYSYWYQFKCWVTKILVLRLGSEQVLTKSLLGNASRYQQIVVKQDYTKG